MPKYATKTYLSAMPSKRFNAAVPSFDPGRPLMLLPPIPPDAAVRDPVRLELAALEAASPTPDDADVLPVGQPSSDLAAAAELNAKKPFPLLPPSFSELTFADGLPDQGDLPPRPPPPPPT